MVDIDLIELFEFICLIEYNYEMNSMIRKCHCRFLKPNFQLLYIFRLRLDVLHGLTH